MIGSPRRWLCRRGDEIRFVPIFASKKSHEKKSKFLKKGIDNSETMVYNGEAVWDTTPQHAAIAQQVERILGKDEVASSNLASSSKPLKLLEFQGFFLFLYQKSDRILFRRFC